MTVYHWLNLCAGLGMFLYGMKMMGDGLERLAGDKLRRFLDILTRNRYLGVLVGLLFTMVIQSSSATTVMLVGFVNAGLMNLGQTVGVIMGANIGTTVTGQLIAFKTVTAIAPVFLLSGVVMLMFFGKKSVQRFGYVIAGFGLLFVGMELMSSSMSPLRDMPQVRSFLVGFTNPLMGILAGALVTAVIQSSSASVGILQALAAQGLIGLHASVYVLLGQKIGTCITALLASIGAGRNARRTAIIHLLFNVLDAILILVLLAIFPIVDWLIAASPDNPMRQIANAHSLFAIIATIVFLPFSNYLIKLAEILVPGEDRQRTEMRLMYLNDRILDTPAIAVAQVLREVERMAQLAVSNLLAAKRALLDGDEQQARIVAEDEHAINFLSHEITGYLVRINQTEMPPADARLIGALFHVVNDLERIGDHAENFTEYASACMEEDISFSEQGISELDDMFDHAIALLNLSLEVFRTSDKQKAQQVDKLEEELDEMERKLRNNHVLRLNQNECLPRSGMIFIDTVSNLERVGDHAINIAYALMETESAAL